MSPLLVSTLLAQVPGQVIVPTPTGAIPNLGQLISSGVTAIIIVAGLLTFLYLVYGGIEWLTSGGDKTKMEEARGKITSAIIGLAIVAAAWAIMKLVGQFFGINIQELNIPNAVTGK